MKDLPSSFSSLPDREPHKYFANLCHDFLKLLHEHPDDLDNLQKEMEQLINASKQMTWKETTHHIWKKAEGDRAMTKVYNEFKRYIDTKSKGETISSYDLRLALEALYQLIESQKVI